MTVKNTERIVELITKSKQNLEASLEFEEKDKLSQERDKLLLVLLFIAYVFIWAYMNYTKVVGSAQQSIGQIDAMKPPEDML